MKALYLVIALSALLAKTIAWGETCVVDGVTWTYTVDEQNKATITRVTPNDGEVLIPTKLGGYDVGCVGKNAFSNSNISAVEIPSGIGAQEGAFYYCRKLTKAILPEDMTIIPTNLFFGCISLSDVKLPAGTKRICKDAFFNCALSTLEIPPTVEKIEQDAFLGFVRKPIYITSLEHWFSIEFESGGNPLSNGNYLYVDGKELTDFVIPDYVESLNTEVMACLSIKSVTIPPSLKSISSAAFRDCTNLRRVDIDSLEHWITTMGPADRYLMAYAGAFYVNGELLTDIVIPDSITDIPSGVFYANTNITSVTFHENVKSINGNSFFGCNKLKKIYIPSWEMWYNIKINDDYAAPMMTGQGEAYVNGELITKIAIPEGMESLGERLFVGWTSVKELHIPSSLKAISSNAFARCDVPDVYIDSLEHWMSLSLSVPGMRHLYINGEEIVDLVIPSSITAFNGGTFSGIDTIETVDVHAGVTTVNFGAISTSPNIKRVRMPSGLGLINKLFPNSYEKIEEIEFAEGTTSLVSQNLVLCSSLKKVIIPSSVTSIQASALPKAKNVELDFSANNNFRWMGEVLVKNDNNEMVFARELPSEFTIPEGIEIIGARALSFHDNLETLIIPEGVKRIAEEGLSYSSIKALKFYASNVICESRAFIGMALETLEIKDIGQWCSNSFVSSNSTDNPLGYTNRLIMDGEVVSKLEIPEGIETIKNHTFYSASDIVSVKLPTSIKSIGTSAFSKNSITELILPHADFQLETIFGTQITDIEFYQPLVRIGEKAFRNQKNLRLETFVLPDTVKEIGANAFEGCNQITDFKIPPLVTKLNDSVFAKTSLAEILIPSHITEMGNAVFSGCTDLKAISFEGDAPIFTGKTFLSLPKDCVIYVPVASTGWGVQVPGELPLTGTSQTVHIRYVPCDQCIDDEPIFSGSSCLSLGTNTFYCAVCKEFLRKEEVPNLNVVSHVAVEHITKQAAYKVPGYADYICKDCGTLIFSAPTPADPYSPNGYHYSSTPRYGGEGPYYEMIDGIKWRYFVTNEVAFVRYEEYLTPAIPIETAGDIVVPERLGRWPLTMLRESPFINCDNLTSITIPASVTNVQDNVFYITRNLEKIIFLGDAPSLSEHPFGRTWGTVYVKPGSKGWNVEIPGFFPPDYDFNRMKIDYLIEEGEESAAEATLRAISAANPKFTYWDCYVAGLNAESKTAELQTSIEMVEGKPVVSYEPDLGEARKYTILGSNNLETWDEVGENAADYHFFKVAVEMKEKVR